MALRTGAATTVPTGERWRWARLQSKTWHENGKKNYAQWARGIAGSSRMDKTRLVEALAAQRSPYSEFSDTIKKAEAATEVEWLSQIARIAKGDHLETTVTEEFDAVGNLKTRTTRTAARRPAWQAYAWLLERRHPERWARTERLPAADGPGTLDPENVIARGEAQMRPIEGGQ